jgi:hypothetical protein
MAGRQIERQAVMARSKPCKWVSELSADAEYREYCLHIDAIAARAGVHRTTVQNALREAQGRGGEPGRIAIITVQERRLRGQRSLTNIIRIVSRDWLNWLHKGPRRPAMGVGSKCAAAKKSSTTDTSLFLTGKPLGTFRTGSIPVKR